AESATSSRIGCGSRFRSLTVSVALESASRNRSTMRLARRVECDASRRALELICRMFIIGSFPDWTAHLQSICCNSESEADKMDNIVPSMKQSPPRDPVRAERRSRPRVPINVAPNDLLLYARVVDERSFSRAAERLGLPKSTVSRRVAALEGQLG